MSTNVRQRIATINLGLVTEAKLNNDPNFGMRCISILNQLTTAAMIRVIQACLYQLERRLDSENVAGVNGIAAGVGNVRGRLLQLEGEYQDCYNHR